MSAHYKNCGECGAKKELRPYGEDGTHICFDCAMKPENKQRTEQTFGSKLLTARKPTGWVKLTEEGPVTMVPMVLEDDES